MTVLLDLSVREISGCAWVTGTKEADTDTEHSTSHPEVSSFPLREAMCQTKKHLLYEVQRSHITKNLPLLLLESVESRLPTRQRCRLLLPLLLLRLHFYSVFHSVSDDFLLVWGGKKSSKIKNGLAKTQQRKINHHQTTASVFTASFIGLWHTF